MVMQEGSSPRDRRILVVSDLHMTAGRDATSGKWSPTEDFFLDDEFARFLGKYTDDRETTLVINGDLFDFLQVLELPAGWLRDRGAVPPTGGVYIETVEWRNATFTYRIPHADVNPRYGLRCTTEATRFLMGRIIEGHETFFEGLVRFAAHGSNRVVILKGNHDVQLYWKDVRDHVHARLAALAADLGIGFDARRIEFAPWFHYEKGLAWIEHGNQYEYTTSFVNFLAPTLPFVYEATGGDEAHEASRDVRGSAATSSDEAHATSGSEARGDAALGDAARGDAAGSDVARSDETVSNTAGVEHIELDFSSFLVRYLTNPGEPLNPLADNIRPLTRYWEGMWREHPFFVLGTIPSAVVFILKAFNKARRTDRETGRRTSRSRRGMSNANAARIRAEAARAGIDEAILFEIEACKQQPTMAHGPWKVIAWFFKPMVVGILWMIPLLIVSANVGEWLGAGPDAGLVERTLRIALQTLVIAVTAAVLVGARQVFKRLKGMHVRTASTAQRSGAASASRQMRERATSNGTHATGASTKPDPSLRPKLVRSPVHDMRTMATYISGLVDVPYVTFGHTHYADVQRIVREGRSDGWYFNTGTWMTIFEPREQLYRDARQLTFLELTQESNGQTRAELHCWYPPASDARPVVIVDMEELDHGVENGVVMSALASISGIGRRL